MGKSANNEPCLGRFDGSIHKGNGNDEDPQESDLDIGSPFDDAPRYSIGSHER